MKVNVINKPQEPKEPTVDFYLEQDGGHTNIHAVIDGTDKVVARFVLNYYGDKDKITLVRVLSTGKTLEKVFSTEPAGNYTQLRVA